MSGGRINLTDNRINEDYNMFVEDTPLTVNFKNEALKSIIETNDLSNIYFSKHNIDYIQRRIQEEVLKLSNGRHRIARQSDTELSIIMRSIYLQFSRNDPNRIREQIVDLDNKVIDDCVPKILSGIEQYLAYKKDVSTMYKPIEYPSASGIKGDKTLEYKPFL